MQQLIFYLTLFLLGAAHALEPGHGKLLVTSYLTGSKARTSDALLLGGLVTITHTLSVAMLGALVVFLAFAFFPENWQRSIEVLSGIVIMGLGALLIWRRFVQHKPKEEEHCDCHLVHSPVVETEPHSRPQSTFREVFLLGLASGVTPCPVALTALIAAFAMGKPISALVALTVFSIGIGAVLIVLGIALIHGSNTLVTRFKRFELAPVYIARVSSVVVLLLGCYLIAKPFFFPEPEDLHASESTEVLMPLFTLDAHR